MKSILFILVLILVIVTTSIASTSYFVFSDVSDEFIIELSNNETIAEARDIIKNNITKSVMGTIVKDKAWYNPKWSFHLDPNTISFFEFAIEVCDASIVYVEEHLAEAGGAFLPGNHWCPWSSKLLKRCRI
ncbi:putative calmodulin-binding protein CaM-BP15 [Heterostelium album PN500]|uniref:Putative calmodulin-binding protein CaM-BP15 n=1 Tax=Heterostelium pallidum (strain ATCC 26659 / Pp 5 / PN500) TaxID=670386 RepID=D3B6A9_HETP5|nr:putative calmodulin-binding protein CaM-BP15 [Heterostelium album PN500]EFA82879.1 putative calmodulin-binding protein CaM-BP15 [Heterostelium album PN500]|eukprot:XP_020434996.1 putative calmodulin-binding protein CaM-BP15 [Heterostelium album PN500]